MLDDKKIREARVGDYVSSLVYGGLDGIITTFAVVSGVAGASLDPVVIIILGFSNLFADGFSMAVGDYLSSKSEYEFEEEERKLDVKKLKHDFENETVNLANIYARKGMAFEDAKTVSTIFAKYPDLMAEQHLGERKVVHWSQPLKNALVTFFSFVVFGFVPLLTYVLVIFIGELAVDSFVLSSIFTGTTLFALGVAKSFITHAKWLKSGLEMLIIGGLAALVAYGVGYVLGN